MRLDTTLSRLSNNFQKISELLQTLLSPENQQSIQDILLNMKEITGTLALNNQRLNLILENAAKTSQQLMPLVQTSTNAMRMLETQTLPIAYRMLSNLDEVTRSLSEISAEVKQNPAVLLRGTSNQNTLGPGEK
jgi:phospholipid/cholesterol/gamma-HCH transport system substrate-binding protein